MKKINYLNIFKQSFEFSWKKKTLWLFGFFMTLSLLGNILFFDQNGNLSFSVDKMSQMLSINNELLVFIVSVSLILIPIALKIIGQASIIKYFSKNKTEKAVFGKMLKDGSQYAKKMFLLEIIFFATTLCLAIVLFLPVFFLIITKAKIAAIFVGLLAGIIFMPVLILFSFIKRFAYIYVVATDLDIKKSIEISYVAFRNNLSESLMFALFVFLTGVATMFIIMAVLILVSIPLVILGAILFFISPSTGIFFVAVSVGYLVALAVFVPVQSFFYVFKEISWVIFLGEIVGIKIEDQKKEAALIAEKEVVAEKMA